jgi:CRP-like cAMP-binding protein
MFIQQADVFWGTSIIFVKEVMKIAKKEYHNKGDFLFHKGDPANHLYILSKGRVKLTIGGEGMTVYIVSDAGDAFGWSSLVGREVYSASAECLESTELISIDKEKFQEVAKKDPVNGLIFYQRLARTIGERLLSSYDIIFAKSQTGSSASSGTRLLQDSDTT